MKNSIFNTNIRTVSPVNFGPIGGTYCWLVRIVDPEWSAVVRFNLKNPKYDIQHWIISALNGPGWSEQQVRLTGYQSLTLLATALAEARIKDSKTYTRAERIRMSIASRTGLFGSKLVWRFNVHTDESLGEILSVFYGTESAIDAFEQEQKLAEGA